MNGVDIISILPFDPRLVWLVVKAAYMLGLLMYVVFAVVVVRQVKMMINALNGMLEAPLRLMSFVHLGLTVGVFLLALVVL